MFSKVLATAGLIASLAINTVNAIPTIEAVGAKFFYSNGTQYYIKGIAYQLTEADPLIDTTQCQLDAVSMEALGANAIRVYHVDPSADHTGCMKAFADAGIYLFVDLETFNTAIDPDHTTWNQTMYEAYAKVMDNFQAFENTAGFFIGNEVIALDNQSLAAPYIKAAARDLKAYRNSKNYRSIPVGYSAADIAQLRPMLQNYLACGNNASESIDMFGLNAYEWCGNNNLQTSGYDILNQYATGYNIPIFFSETGCNTVQPRTFEDQSAIFGPVMNGIWSGAIIYEWIEETNNYGLISYGPSAAATAVATNTNIVAGISRTGTPLPVTPDYSNLQAQWATLTPTGTASSAYTPSLSPPACPTSTAGGWLVNGDVALPSLGQTLSTDASGATATATATTSSAQSTATKKSGSNGGKEIAGMSAGLVGVMLGFMYWL